MWHAASFSPGSVTLRPGDVLVLYTDGVVEVMNPSGEMFGLDRLEEAVRAPHGASARARVEAVLEATRAFAGRDGYDDDFTLVIVGRDGAPAGTAA
jgi:sigma-B regulation protein RsbU (phosphoserine phosphatase)